MTKSTPKLPTKALKERAGELPAPYVMKPDEQRAINAYVERYVRVGPMPIQIIESERGGLLFKDDHPDPSIGAMLTMEALGLTRLEELTALLGNVVDLTKKDNKPDEVGVNRMLAQIAAIEPNDGIEYSILAGIVGCDAIFAGLGNRACRCSRSRCKS